MLERIQKGLKCSLEEAQDVLAYDKTIKDDNEGEAEFDLSPEKAAIAKKFSHTGTRKAPTAYKFTQRKRKENATKGGIIAELSDFFTKMSEFNVENFQIPSKEGKISFKIGEKWYSLTLTEHRTKPKWCE